MLTISKSTAKVNTFSETHKCFLEKLKSVSELSMQKMNVLGDWFVSNVIRSELSE